MLYRNYADQKVSPVCLKLTASSLPLAGRAADHGINYFYAADAALLSCMKNRKNVVLHTCLSTVASGYEALRADIIALLQKAELDRIDILDFYPADESGEETKYLSRLGESIKRLKQEGLFRYANAVADGGNDAVLRQVRCGHFDSVLLDYNIAQMQVNEFVLPAVYQSGLSLLARHPFLRGRLFDMARETGSKDDSLAARVGIKWILGSTAVTAALCGIQTEQHLDNLCKAVEEPRMTAQETQLLEDLFETPQYIETLENNIASFFL